MGIYLVTGRFQMTIKFKTYVLYVAFALSLSIPLAIHHYYHYNAERLEMGIRIQEFGSELSRAKTEIHQLKQLVRELSAQKESPTEVRLSRMVVD